MHTVREYWNNGVLIDYIVFIVLPLRDGNDFGEWTDYKNHEVFRSPKQSVAWAVCSMLNGSGGLLLQENINAIQHTLNLDK